MRAIMDNQVTIDMESLSPRSGDTFDYRRANTVDQMRGFVTSFAVCEEVTKEKASGCNHFFEMVNSKYSRQNI